MPSGFLRTPATAAGAFGNAGANAGAGRWAALLLAMICAGSVDASPVQPAAAPVDRVRPLAGSSNSRWQLYPGAAVPFGMVKLSPDNQGNVWNGGYEYTVASISGFSHLHAMGLSALSIMPVVGRLQVDPTSSRFHAGAADGPFGGMWTAGYRSRIDKASEAASPGYYSAQLIDYGVKAEASATARVGYLRLTFPQTADAHLFIDFDFPTEEKNTILAVEFRQTGPAEYEGHVRQRNQYAATHDVYFVIQLSRAALAGSTWRNGDYTGSDTGYGVDWRRSVDLRPLVGTFSGGPRTGVVLDFAATGAGERIIVRSALSFVDMAGARANMAAETAAPGWDFDAVVAAARAQWAAKIDVVAVSDENPAASDMFYTAMYRAFAGKSVLNDVDGRYRAFDGTIARLGPRADAVYSSDGLWGMQWNLAPMWGLLAPQVAVSMSNSLLELQTRGGWIPTAPVALRYAPIMVAQHQNTLIVGAIQKGLKGIDENHAYRAIRHDLMTQGTALPDGQYAGNRQLATYLKHGFVPAADGPSSNTLEYAYDDHCMAQFAKSRRNAGDAAMFGRRAASWRRQFDPASGYARPRNADGTFVQAFDPMVYGTIGGWNGPGFVEGNAWTYSYWVPHDVPGLISLVGRDRFNARLEAGFANGDVDLANQPGLQSPFLFNTSGKPWLTQKWTRKIVADMYDTSPLRGWLGEEDEGQLTAYYVLLSLGLFEMDGGCAVQPMYDLTSPAFARAVIRLDPVHYGGRTLTIETTGPPGAVYIQSATFNGIPLVQPRLAHAALVGGGVLRYVLGREPNTAWGAVPMPRAGRVAP
jgi:predicted alpha-1,2-mannosidase